MKLSNFSNILILAPLAIGFAQTPQPTPKATPPPPSTAARAPLALEDVPGTDPVVLTVGDDKMTKSEFEWLIAGLPQQAQARAQGPGGKRQIAEQVVQLKAMAQEARKRGVDKTEQAKELIKFQTDSVLANALYREISTGVKADDAAAQAYYDAHKADYDQVTASHILIRYKGSAVPMKAGGKELTPEEALAKAQDIRKRLTAGEDFAKVASAESDDEMSAKIGGSLGEPFVHGRMVPAFEEVAFKQPVGELSEPVKTQFGYHIIKVTKHETASFDSVKTSIEQKLKPEMAQKAVEDIRKQAAVTLNDTYFGK